jgi:chemotaxis protein methyltransferase CheR
MDGSVTRGGDVFNPLDMSILSDEQFERLRGLGGRLAGLELFDRHRELLDRRLQRMGIHDGKGFACCLDAAERGDPAAMQQVVGLLTTKHTGFFRHPWQFDIAAEHLLWAAQGRGHARAWCAAAATGEEPYSLAMALLEVFRANIPAVAILATDIDGDAIEFARRAEYDEAGLQDLHPGRRERFFHGAGTRRTVAPRVRGLVEFRSMNLVDRSWRLPAPFDAIFCRNALMYLTASNRLGVLERMATLLAPGGLLFIDPTEHLGSAAHGFTPRGNGAYSLAGGRLAPMAPRAASVNRCPDEGGS